MSIPAITTLLAVDAQHLAELRLSCETWRIHKPEIWQQPLLVVLDFDMDPDCLAFLQHPNARFIYPPIFWRKFPQREKMLSSFVAAADFIETPYYLKLDTDAVATASGPWIDPAWFGDGSPAFIASLWRYTKPADAIQRLDDWGDGAPGLKEHPRLDLPFDPNSTRVAHRRITSWCFIGNTIWTQCAGETAWGSNYNRLPIPSHDTFLWYCATRRREYYITARMAKRGWAHVHPSKLESVCKEILSRWAESR